MCLRRFSSPQSLSTVSSDKANTICVLARLAGLGILDYILENQPLEKAEEKPWPCPGAAKAAT